MLLALIALVISASTVVGVLALGAAMANWPWYQRTFCAVSVPGLLLLIPAYELVVVYSVQIATVVAVLSLGRAIPRQRRRDSDTVRTSSVAHRQLHDFGYSAGAGSVQCGHDSADRQLRFVYVQPRPAAGRD